MEKSNLENEIDNEIDKYANLMAEISNRWSDEIGYAQWVYEETYLTVLEKTDDQLTAYKIAYKALENLYKSLEDGEYFDRRRKIIGY